MSDSSDAIDTALTKDQTPAEPRPKAEPIDSRFLFVDIAAMRAKQLRRGARPRLDEEDTATDTNRAQPHKAERVAMEEVRRRLVQFDLPPNKPPVAGNDVSV
jgi:DNA-directed RNA polymerase subunit K/omega